jgi:hypothetical protein
MNDMKLNLVKCKECSKEIPDTFIKDTDGLCFECIRKKFEKNEKKEENN